MTLEERLNQIRNKIAADWGLRAIPNIDPLPPRSPDLEGRIEYVLNAYELAKMELIDAHRPKWPQGVDWIALEHLTTAVKPVSLSWCERTEIRVKRRLRLLGEWLFRASR